MQDLDSHENCLNCGTKVQQNYCTNCGQKYGLGRLESKQLLQLAASFTLEADNRIWRTLKELLYNPGKVSAAYVEGKRASYLNPINIYFIMVAVFFTISFFFGYFTEAWKGLETQSRLFIDISMAANINAVELITTTSGLFSVWIKEIAVATKPLTALFLYWLYRGHNRNYPEILVFLLYLGAQNFFIISGFFLLEELTGIHMFDGIGLTVWMVYFIVGSKSFFKLSWPKTILYALPAFVLDWSALYILAFLLGHLKLIGLF